MDLYEFETILVYIESVDQSLGKDPFSKNKKYADLGFFLLLSEHCRKERPGPLRAEAIRDCWIHLYTAGLNKLTWR